MKIGWISEVTNIARKSQDDWSISPSNNIPRVAMEGEQTLKYFLNKS